MMVMVSSYLIIDGFPSPVHPVRKAHRHGDPSPMPVEEIPDPYHDYHGSSSGRHEDDPDDYPDEQADRHEDKNIPPAGLGDGGELAMLLVIREPVAHSSFSSWSSPQRSSRQREGNSACPLR